MCGTEWPDREACIHFTWDNAHIFQCLHFTDSVLQLLPPKTSNFSIDTLVPLIYGEHCIEHLYCVKLGGIILLKGELPFSTSH